MINIRNNHINEIGALVLFAAYYYVFSIDTNNESYIQYKKHLCTDSATNYISDWVRGMDD